MSVVSGARRLAEMSREELRFRLQCQARRIFARARHRVSVPRWDRRAILSVLDASTSPETAEARRAARRGDFLAAHRALASYFCSRQSPWPVNARSRDALVESIQRRFPDAVKEAARRGDALAAGRHDLLGYRAVECGTPPDWHLDPVHGARPPRVFWSAVPYLDPACGDHKIIWELNRHQHWRALGRAFWLTGDVRYRDVFVAELETWLKANPPGTGVNWASMLELGFRTLSWTWAVEFFSPGADRDRTPWLVDLLVALDRQLAHIAHNLSLYFSPNTHLSGEALALYAVSRAFSELRGSTARADRGREVLLRQSERQIGADGGHAELSAHYHRYSTDFYLLALLVARSSEDAVAPRFEAVARAQARYLRTLADENGRLPLIGDDDGGQLFGICGERPVDASSTLAAAAAILDEAPLAVSPASEEVHWILGQPPAVSLAAGVKKPWPSRELTSGYFVSRTPEGDHLVFDAGPHGFLNGGHAHSDALSIVLTVAGTEVLVDPGTATYTMDPVMRDRFRSTRMHNTVVIDGEDHAEPDGPFHWRRRADARMLFSRIEPRFDFAQGTHDAYGRTAHVRSVIGLHGIGWVIVDQIIAERTVTAESWWHLHPDWRPSVRQHDVVLRRANRPALALAFSEGDVVVFFDSDFAMYAPEYGQVERAPVIRVTERRAAPFSIGTFIPTSAHAESATIASVPMDTAPPHGWVGAAFRVHARDLELLVLVATPSQHQISDGPGKPWGISAVQTDARVLVERTLGNAWETRAIAGGRRLDRTPGLASAVHVSTSATVDTQAVAID